MPIWLRTATLLVAIVLMSTACGDVATRSLPSTPVATPTTAATPAPTATVAPTATPAPTAVPLLADDVRVAGVDVGGLSLEQASLKIEQALAPLFRPLELRAGDAQAIVKPEDIDLRLPLDELLAQAQAAGAGARIALRVQYDADRLRAAVETLAQQAALPTSLAVISDTETLSRSFVLVPGERVDVDAALAQLDERLQAPGSPRRVTLTLAPYADPQARPDPALLQQQIEEMVGQWNGIAGVYVYDLAGDEVVASLNQDSVFSGASVMKVPILLYSYIKLKTFDEDQEKWLKKMIVDSDNLSANQMLAASAGGSGTEDALVGALDMSEMLKDLGLEHTYQNMPYEASDYLIKVRGFKIKRGPEREGPAPHTEADPVLRTTPAEMSQIFLWIDQCSRGTGVLLERFSSSLTAARCREMIDRLEQNGDHTRMLAGFPDDTRVAHKSGWIEDMQADVGIVRSPGADFVLAIYLYRDIIPGKTYLADEIAAPVIADVARLVYTYYNPVRPLE